MAVRKVYLPVSEFPYFREISVTFPWSNGSRHQIIQAVQEAFHGLHPDIPALEVSLASPQQEGVGVAAMKLPLRLATQEQEIPVGIIYQASRVFENGGPYLELLQCSRQTVQKERRLQQSGKCIRYQLEGKEFLLEPYPYAFFNWLYGRALQQNPEKAEGILKFGAFTDLDLGSAKKDRNSPARAAAVYVGLAAAGRLSCLDSYEAFAAETCEEPTEKSGEKPLEQPELSPEVVPESVQEISAPAKIEPEDKTAPEAEKSKEAEPTPEPAALESATPEPATPGTAEPEESILPTVEQLKEICHAQKVKNLMISLAKNAGCSAKTAAGVVNEGRRLLLTSYQKAQEAGTVVINPEKNKITFPLENPDTGFSTIGLLTRSPSFVQGWKLSYQSCETATPAEEPAPAEPEEPVYPTAEDYLVSRGYVIAQQVLPEQLPPPAVRKLAWETGEASRDPAAAAFLQFIRTHLQFHDSFTFRMPKDASDESRECAVELAQKWDHLGLFSSFNANTARIICALASDNEMVRSFASGHWLELYVVRSIQQVLDRWQKEQNASVSLCSNVILSGAADAAFSHELDAAFSVNGKFFWIEAKSSSRNIDYGKYAELCRKLQVPPEQLLLVNSDLSEEDCAGVSYFWPYRIANCATMTQELEAMIRRALNLPDAGNAEKE